MALCLVKHRDNFHRRLVCVATAHLLLTVQCHLRHRWIEIRRVRSRRSLLQYDFGFSSVFRNVPHWTLLISRASAAVKESLFWPQITKILRILFCLNLLNFISCLNLQNFYVWTCSNFTLSEPAHPLTLSKSAQILTLSELAHPLTLSEPAQILTLTEPIHILVWTCSTSYVAWTCSNSYVVWTCSTSYAA